MQRPGAAEPSPDRKADKEPDKASDQAPDKAPGTDPKGPPCEPAGAPEDPQSRKPARKVPRTLLDMEFCRKIFSRVNSEKLAQTEQNEIYRAAPAEIKADSMPEITNYRHARLRKLRTRIFTPAALILALLAMAALAFALFVSPRTEVTKANKPGDAGDQSPANNDRVIVTTRVMPPQTPDGQRQPLTGSSSVALPAVAPPSASQSCNGNNLQQNIPSSNAIKYRSLIDNLP